jgi:hypothetical protein
VGYKVMFEEQRPWQALAPMGARGCFQSVTSKMRRRVVPQNVIEILLKQGALAFPDRQIAPQAGASFGACSS